VFKQHEAPEDVPDHALPASDLVWVPGLLQDAGLVSSNSEGRRMLAQGAVKIDGVKVGDESLPRSELMDVVIQVGKRRFARLVDG
jgi:tyrosyl-tRNA synthetase